MVIAVALVLIVVGSVVFHFLSPWWWTPIASNWGCRRTPGGGKAVWCEFALPRTQTT